MALPPLAARPAQPTTGINPARAKVAYFKRSAPDIFHLSWGRFLRSLVWRHSTPSVPQQRYYRIPMLFHTKPYSRYARLRHAFLGLLVVHLYSLSTLLLFRRPHLSGHALHHSYRRKRQNLSVVCRHLVPLHLIDH